MKLLTKELERRFAEVGKQQDSDPLVIAKYFNPTGGQSWFATEYCPADKTFYGYASLFGDYNDEWGYFSLSELESVQGQFGLGIERDLYCGEMRISEHNIPSLTTK
jgi:hypothetical protein